MYQLPNFHEPIDFDFDFSNTKRFIKLQNKSLSLELKAQKRAIKETFVKYSNNEYDDADDDAESSDNEEYVLLDKESKYKRYIENLEMKAQFKAIEDRLTAYFVLLIKEGTYYNFHKSTISALKKLQEANALANYKNIKI
jgi:hypothetical protein